MNNSTVDGQNQLSFSRFFELEIFNGRKNQLLVWLKDRLIFEKKVTILLTPNAEQIVLSRENPTFLSHLQAADVLIPDGAGLVIASKIISKLAKDSNKLRARSLTERITGVDIVRNLLEMAANHDQKILVIGGRDYHQLKLTNNWQIKEKNQLDLYEFSNVSAGKRLSFFWTSAYEDVNCPGQDEENKLLQQVSSLKPDGVLVAFGAPLQEKWLIDHKDFLTDSGVKLAMSVGGSIDFILGKAKRAPVWMQNLALEWLFRLLTEPWRWRRQLRLIKFWGWVAREIW
ncbi:MAG: WecB/TagA/CpsF family glycosyltransferase [Patescibacteria group bacterium]